MVATGTDIKITSALRQSQANAVVLYLNAKRYHWFTYGPLFRDLHLFFDELAADALAEVDPFGERARMLGADALSTPREIESCTSVRIAEGKPSPKEMLDEALANERRVIREMRAGARIAEEEDDYGTNDLFSTLVQTHEKHAWFIEEFLRRNDGMVA